jgi:hypothetical protein
MISGRQEVYHHVYAVEDELLLPSLDGDDALHAEDVRALGP